MTGTLKKSLKMPKKMAIWLIFPLLAFFSVAHGEQYNGDGFSIEIPPDFTRAPSPHPSVVLVLRPKTQGFPTFNVVSESTALKSNLSREEFGELVLRGYKQVGFTDAAIKSSTTVSSDRWRAEILYSQGNEQFRALVEGINAPDRHFILTFIDKEASADRSRFLQSTLTNSFKVLAKASNQDEGEAKFLSFKSIFQFLIFAVCIVTVVLLVRTYRKETDQ